MSCLDKPAFDSEVSKKSALLPKRTMRGKVLRLKEEKECEHDVTMRSHPKRVNAGGTGHHPRYYHHEHLEMGKRKKYAFHILSSGHMYLFPTSANRIRLAPQSQQGDWNCANRLLVSHGLMPSTSLSDYCDLERLGMYLPQKWRDEYIKWRNECPHVIR